MAQTNFTPIQLYRSPTAAAVPLAANLLPGELAINYADGRLYYEDAAGVVQLIGAKLSGAAMATFLGAPSSANLAAVVTDETGSGALVFGTAPTLANPVITGGSINNAPIGATTPQTGAFTTLSATGNATVGNVLTVGNATGASVLTLNADDASPAEVRYLDEGVLRWNWVKTAVNVMGLFYYDTAGAFVDTAMQFADGGGPITINRATTFGANAVTIGAGTINNAPIGATTPSTGAFTALTTTGAATIGAAAASNTGVSVQSAAGTNADLHLNSGAVQRWTARRNNVAETGADAGSNFQLIARTDAGAVIDNPITIVRAAGGAMTLTRPTSIAAQLTLAPGNATAPAYSFSGDTDTGIYSNTANEVAVVTGGTFAGKFDSGQRLLLGNAVADGATSLDKLQYNTIDGGGFGVGLSHWSATNGSKRLNFYRSRGATVGAQSALLNGDQIGTIGALGSDGSAMVTAASIQFFANNTFAAGVGDGRILFAVNTGGAATTPLDLLPNQARFALGSAAAPSLSFAGDANTGIYSPAADQISLSTAGVQRVVLDSAGRTIIGHSENVTVSGFNSVLQIHGSVAANTSSSATAKWSVDTSGPIFTLAKSRGAAVGTFAAVAAGDTLGNIYFTGDDGTNLNTLGIVIRADVKSGATVSAGVVPSQLVVATMDNAGSRAARLTVSDVGIAAQSGAPFLAAAGTAAAPSIAFLADTDTGIYSPAANTIAKVTAGVERMRIDASGSVVQTQAALAAVNATATLTVANLRTRIITSTTAAAVTATLPTGTDMDTLYNAQTDMGYDWSAINTGATNPFTVAANTGHTTVGNMVVAANGSGWFRSRRTAANTWITYRVG